jgi:hypothetical protein
VFIAFPSRPAFPSNDHSSSFPRLPSIYLQVGRPFSKTLALHLTVLLSMQFKAPLPLSHQQKELSKDEDRYLQLKLAPRGKQRPAAPVAVVHTSSFKLVLGTQQLPDATGRLALAPARSWRRTSRRMAPSRGVSTVAAVAKAMRAKKAMVLVNCILSVG